MRNLRTIAFILMIMLSFTSCKKEHATLSGETEFLLGTWMNTTPNQPISKIIFDRKGCYIEYSKVRNDYMRYGEITINEEKSYYGNLTYKEIAIFNINKKTETLGGIGIRLLKNNDNEYNLNQFSLYHPLKLYHSDDNLIFLIFKKQ